MKRLFAVAGLAVFLVACSETTIPDSLRQAHVAAKDGIPPPPPLPGDGSGDLDLRGVSTDAATTNSQTQCSGPNFVLIYTFTYNQNDPQYNQVAHLDVNGTVNGVTVTGSIDLHQNENGKSNAHGQLSSSSGSSFTIQGGTDNFPLGEFDRLGFNFTVNGILTDSNGNKCQATGKLSGSLFGDD